MVHVQQLIQAWTELGGLRLGKVEGPSGCVEKFAENQYLPFIILQI